MGTQASHFEDRARAAQQQAHREAAAKASEAAAGMRSELGEREATISELQREVRTHHSSAVTCLKKSLTVDAGPDGRAACGREIGRGGACEGDGGSAARAGRLGVAAPRGRRRAGGAKLGGQLLDGAAPSILQGHVLVFLTAALVCRARFRTAKLRFGRQRRSATRRSRRVRLWRRRQRRAAGWPARFTESAPRGRSSLSRFALGDSLRLCSLAGCCQRLTHQLS